MSRAIINTQSRLHTKKFLASNDSVVELTTRAIVYLVVVVAIQETAHAVIRR